MLGHVFHRSADVYTIGSSFVYTLHYQKMNSCNNNIVILLSKDNHMVRYDTLKKKITEVTFFF